MASSRSQFPFWLALGLCLGSCSYAPRPAAETIAPLQVHRRSLLAATAPETKAFLPQTPLSARFQFTGERPATLKFARYADRIVYRDLRRRDEWEFRVHPMRRDLLAASTIDHARRELVHWNHLDLRDRGLPTDWQRLSGFGIDAALLSRLEATQNSKTTYGVVFSQYVAGPQSLQTDPIEVWWNEALRLPLTIVRATGTQQLTFCASEPPPHRPLQTRYARYRQVSLHTWLERHYACCRL